MDEITIKDIENNHRITRKTDSEFLYEFQKAVLLALLEDGTLTEMQYRYAEEKLRRQNFLDSQSSKPFPVRRERLFLDEIVTI